MNVDQSFEIDEETRHQRKRKCKDVSRQRTIVDACYDNLFLFSIIFLW